MFSIQSIPIYKTIVSRMSVREASARERKRRLQSIRKRVCLLLWLSVNNTISLHSMYVYLFIRNFSRLELVVKMKSFVSLTEQWSITYIHTWKNIQLNIKKCFTYEYVKTCLNKFNMYILSELENMLHVVHVVLVLLPLLSVFFFEIQKVQIDPSKVTPCSPNQILSSFLYISYHLTTKNQLQMTL